MLILTLKPDPDPNPHPDPDPDPDPNPHRNRDPDQAPDLAEGTQVGEDMDHWLNMRMGLEPVDQPGGSDDEPPFRPSKPPEPARTASEILAAARAKASARASVDPGPFSEV